MSDNQAKKEVVSKFNLKRFALSLGGSFLLLCTTANANAPYEEGVTGTLKTFPEASQAQTMPQQPSTDDILQESTTIKEWIDKCEGNDYASCNVLAQVYLEQKLYPQAARYLEKVCYSNSTDADKACAGLTSLLTFEDYNVVNLDKAQEVARYLCETKSIPFGCLALSQLYLRPEFKDPNSSFEYAQKACELNDATGCKQVALTIYSQAYGQKDIGKAQIAFEFYKKACELGDTDSCDTYGPHVEKLQQFQRYVERSKEQAAQAAAQAAEAAFADE